jgi:hypothetical protein
MRAGSAGRPTHSRARPVACRRAGLGARSQAAATRWSGPCRVEGGSRARQAHGHAGMQASARHSQGAGVQGGRARAGPGQAGPGQGQAGGRQGQGRQGQGAGRSRPRSPSSAHLQVQQLLDCLAPDVLDLAHVVVHQRDVCLVGLLHAPRGHLRGKGRRAGARGGGASRKGRGVGCAAAQRAGGRGRQAEASAGGRQHASTPSAPAPQRSSHPPQTPPRRSSARPPGWRPRRRTRTPPFGRAGGAL